MEIGIIVLVFTLGIIIGNLMKAVKPSDIKQSQNVSTHDVPNDAEVEVRINGSNVYSNTIANTFASVKIILNGNVSKIITSSGDVEVLGMCSGDIHTNSGDVVVGVCKDITTSSGDIEVSETANNITTISGDVEVGGNVSGNVKTNSGSINVG